MVRLDFHEAFSAATAGVIRRLESRYRGRKDKMKPGDPVWDADIEGVMAEVAVAKMLGVYFAPTIRSFKDADIGKLLQVRQTSYPNGRLILQPNDNPDHVYILVVTTLPMVGCGAEMAN